MSGNPAPGYQKKPDHKVEATPFNGRVCANFNGVAIAETTSALAVQETGYPLVYYMPRSDVRMYLARKTDRQSHCPFKGDAAYFSFAVDGAETENAAWSYEAPYDEAAALKDHLAFYGNRIDALDVA